MKKNLNDDTRYVKKWEEPAVEKNNGWFPIILLIALILLLAYFIFR